MTQKEKARIYDAEQLVARFNKLYPVGSKVNLRKMAIKSAPYIECTVKREAFLSHGNEPVAFFNEISGYFSIEPDFINYN
jgi:hypothetical protein